MSTDQGPSQKAFAANCGVTGFPILSDFRHQVVQAYGIHRPTGGAPNERATFIVDKDGTLAYAYVEPVIGDWQGIDPELTELRKVQ
ncbi:MAG: redoxin domain-containing protein [Chloroflexota bacterium]